MGQSWLQQQDVKGLPLNPKITATHPLASSDVEDGRASAQLFPHLVYPESPSAWGHVGAVLPRGLEQAGHDHSQEKAGLRYGKTSCSPSTPSPGKTSPWLGKNRHKIENEMCRITSPRWAALHHSPQKHSSVTVTNLIQAGCWCLQGSFVWFVPLKCRRWGREDKPQAASALGHHPCGPRGKPLFTAVPHVPLSG